MLIHGSPIRWTLGAIPPTSSYCSVGDPPYWKGCMTLSEVPEAERPDNAKGMLPHVYFIRTPGVSNAFFCEVCRPLPRAAESEAGDRAPDPPPPTAAVSDQCGHPVAVSVVDAGHEHPNGDEGGGLLGRALLEPEPGVVGVAVVGGEVAVPDLALLEHATGETEGHASHGGIVHDDVKATTASFDREPSGPPWGIGKPVWETLANPRHAAAAREVWEERAAIMEYDGGLPRMLAEWDAYRDLVSRMTPA